MSMRRSTSHRRLKDDAGSALVAALGVAMVGMLLATVVITQAVIVNNDSGRNRARTMQVHGAEGAIDQVYGLLETGSPCRWPATGVHAVSTSPDETNVSAAIAYWDKDNNPLTCSDTGISGVPATAVITATSQSVNLPGFGVDPTRTIQARVLLTPLTEPGAGAAIFSSYATGNITNDFTLLNGEPDSNADLWIDSGDVGCTTNATINGRVFVADGGLTMSNNCKVTGDVRVKKALTMNQGTINGSVFVYASNATLNGTSAHIGGNLTTSGTAINSQNRAGGVGAVQPMVGGTIATGWAPPAAGIVKVPLPEVTKKFSDWPGYNTSISFASWTNSEAVANGAPTWVPFRNGDPCSSQISNASWSMNNNIKTPVGKTIIDATGCSNGFRAQNVNITLRGDLVIFANQFTFTNTVKILSDGGDYKLWIIVPDQVANGVANCTAPGNIDVSVAIDFGGPKILTFLYTPCSASVSNNVKLTGQIYARDVKLQNQLTVTYRAIGIPGVDLFPGAPVAGAGYVVEVVYKREIGKPTP